jgi:hypothetical protein
MGPHKITNFCKAKDTVNKIKRPPTDWERIFKNPKSDGGLISNIYIYIYLKKLDSKNQIAVFKKWVTKLNKERSSEEYLMAEKHLKKMFNILNHQGNANQYLILKVLLKNVCLWFQLIANFSLAGSHPNLSVLFPLIPIICDRL